MAPNQNKDYRTGQRVVALGFPDGTVTLLSETESLIESHKKYGQAGNIIIEWRGMNGDPDRLSWEVILVSGYQKSPQIFYEFDAALDFARNKSGQSG